VTGESFTYDAVVADIIKVSATGDTPETQEWVRVRCEAMRGILVELAKREGGYIFLAMFYVAMNEMKVILKSAQGKDKQLIEQLIDACIGGYGKVLN
jgi:hypothetical protein